MWRRENKAQDAALKGHVPVVVTGGTIEGAIRRLDRFMIQFHDTAIVSKVHSKARGLMELVSPIHVTEGVLEPWSSFCEHIARVVTAKDR